MTVLIICNPSKNASGTCCIRYISSSSQHTKIDRKCGLKYSVLLPDHPNDALLQLSRSIRIPLFSCFLQCVDAESFILLYLVCVKFSSLLQQSIVLFTQDLQESNTISFCVVFRAANSATTLPYRHSSVSRAPITLYFATQGVE